jgi:predicted PurR-regulated permease PerM
MSIISKRHDYLYWIVWAGFTVLSLIVLLSPLSTVLYIVLTAFILSYLLAPVVSWLESPYYGNHALPFHIPRLISSLILPFGIVFSGFYLLTLLFISIIRDIPKSKIYINQAIVYYNQKMIPYIDSKMGADFLEKHPIDIQTDALIILMTNQAKSSISLLPNIAGAATGTISNILNILLWCILVPLMIFYILSNWSHICQSHRLFWSRYLPIRHQDIVQKVLTDIDLILQSLIKGQITVCLTMAVIYAIALSIIGLPFGVLIGFIAGLACCIPIVGVAFPLLISLIVAGFDPELNQHIFVYLEIIAVFILGGFILEGKILSPKLIGDKIEVPGALVILGILAGEKTAGVLGMLLALPILSICKVFASTFSDWWLSAGRPEIHMGLLNMPRTSEAQMTNDSSNLSIHESILKDTIIASHQVSFEASIDTSIDTSIDINSQSSTQSSTPLILSKPEKNET